MNPAPHPLPLSSPAPHGPLVEQWARLAPPATLPAEALSRLAEQLTEAARQGDPAGVGAVGSGLVTLGLSGAPLADALTHAAAWMGSLCDAPPIEALHAGSFRALEEQRRQQEEAVQRYDAILRHLDDALATSTLPSTALIPLGLDLLRRELGAEGSALLHREGPSWSVQATRGQLPDRLLSEQLPGQPYEPVAQAMQGGFQIAIPLREERGLLLIALSSEPCQSAALVDRLVVMASLLTRAVERARLQELVNKQADALRTPRQGTDELVRRASNRWLPTGLMLDENDALLPLPEPPQVPISTTQGQIVLPLDVRGEMVGKLMLEDERDEEWSDHEIELITVVAERMSQAMEMARLFRDSERRAAQLAAASEVSRAATRLLSVEELMQAAVERIISSFSYYHAQVFLVDDERRWAVLRSSTGEAGKALLARGHKLEVGSRSIIGYVTATGEPLAARDTDSDQEGWIFNELLSQTRAELAVPLRVGSTIIGALDVQSTSPTDFAEDEVRVLQTLADQMAIAIENARAYEQQKESAEQLRELDKLKSQFLASMSHELRTPLNSIIGFSRVILKGIDGPITDLQRKDLNTIYNSGQILLQLIDSILDISKIEAGKMELDFEQVDLRQTIEVALNTAAGLIKDRPVQLVRELPDQLPSIRADSVRLRQVLLNLLSNAAKFTEQGSIRLTATQIGDEISISVSDTGVGIPPEKQEHLYDAFYQVDGSATRRAGGSGLGLAISRSFVEMHGGRIWVESEGVAGKGATFTFTLPIAGPQEGRRENSGPPLILVVDAQQGITMLYERYLRLEGYRFVACHESSEVAQQAASLQPALILLDLQMPGMDGFEVLAALRADILTRDIPVVACSMQESGAVEQRALSAGASDFLQKPLLRQQLVAAARRWAGVPTEAKVQ